METLTKHFESRVGASLERTGLKPSTFGLRATGDPNLMRQLRLGRSPTLKMADRILAFMDAHDQVYEDQVSSRSRPRGDPSFRSTRDSLVTKAIEQDMEAPARVLPLPGVEARTGLSRSTIYVRVDNGSFPKPIRLGARAIGWIESEVDQWIHEQIAASRGRAE